MGAGLLSWLPESERAGDFEGHVGRVDVVVFAVVENGAEIDDRSRRRITARGGFREFLFSTEGIQFLGMAPPKTSSTNSIAFAALDRLHFNAADAKLTVTAGAFVLAFRRRPRPRMVSR